MKAFPSNGFYEKTGGGEQPQKLEPIMGMDLRDYFAGQALPSLVINKEVHKVIYQIASQESKTPEECLAIMSYAVADAMMKARVA